MVASQDSELAHSQSQAECLFKKGSVLVLDRMDFIGKGVLLSCGAGYTFQLSKRESIVRIVWLMQEKFEKTFVKHFVRHYSR